MLIVNETQTCRKSDYLSCREMTWVEMLLQKVEQKEVCVWERAGESVRRLAALTRVHIISGGDREKQAGKDGQATLHR